MTQQTGAPWPDVEPTDAPIPDGTTASPTRALLSAVVACWFGAAAVSWARLTITGTIRIDDVRPAWLASILPQFAFGVLAAIGAWLYLRLYKRRAQGMPRRLGRALLFGALAANIVAAISLPLTTNDLFSNLAYGRLTSLGFNPYRATPEVLPSDDPFGALVGSRWRNTPTVYGPVLAMANALAGRASTVPYAMAAFKLMSLAAVAASVLIAYRICRSRFSEGRARSSFVLYAFSPVLVWELSAQSHNDAFMVLAMVGFAWAALEKREWVAIACLSLALYAKLAVAPLLVLYLVSIARRSLSRAALMTIAVVAIGAILLAPYWDGLGTLRGPSATIGGNMSRTARSFGDLVCLGAAWFGGSTQWIAYRIVWVGGLLVLAVVFVRGLVAVRSTEDVIHHSLLVLGAYCLLGTPWFQPWYVCWLMPLALVHDDPRWQGTTALYGALTPVQYVLPLDPVTTIALNVFVLAKALPLLREPYPAPARSS